MWFGKSQVEARKIVWCRLDGGSSWRGGSYLNFRYNVAPLHAGPSEGGERSGCHHGAGPGEAAQVTAGDVIDLVPHDDCVHDEEAPPRQPQGVLLGDEGSTLKAQGDGHTSAGDQVEAERDNQSTQGQKSHTVAPPINS